MIIGFEVCADACPVALCPTIVLQCISMYLGGRKEDTYNNKRCAGAPVSGRRVLRVGMSTLVP